MMTPYSSEDLGRVFDARILTKGRTLILRGGVEVTLDDGGSVAAVVEDEGGRHKASITPLKFGDRVAFSNTCSCGHRSCEHQAAGALAALERFPSLRKLAQATMLDTLTGAPAVPRPVAPAPEARRLVFELSPADPPIACYVSALLIGEKTGQIGSTTPARILANKSASESARMAARLLAGADIGSDPARVAVAPASVTSVLGLLARLGSARWHATGKTLSLGPDRSFPANLPPDLPEGSGIILGGAGPWYVDGATGAAGRVRVAKPVPSPDAPPPPPPTPRPNFARQVRPAPPRTVEPVILERPPTPVLHLRRIEAPDAGGRMQPTDALMLGFDYEGALVPFDDDRQFVRVQRPGDRPDHPSFIRRDKQGGGGGAGVAAAGRVHGDAGGGECGGQGADGARVPRARRGGAVAGVPDQPVAGAAGDRVDAGDGRGVRAGFGAGRGL